MDEMITVQMPEELFRFLQKQVTDLATTPMKGCLSCGGEIFHEEGCPFMQLREVIVNEEGVL